MRHRCCGHRHRWWIVDQQKQHVSSTLLDHESSAGGTAASHNEATRPKVRGPLFRRSFWRAPQVPAVPRFVGSAAPAPLASRAPSPLGLSQQGSLHHALCLPSRRPEASFALHRPNQWSESGVCRKCSWRGSFNPVGLARHMVPRLPLPCSIRRGPRRRRLRRRSRRWLKSTEESNIS